MVANELVLWAIAPEISSNPFSIKISSDEDAAKLLEAVFEERPLFESPDKIELYKVTGVLLEDDDTLTTFEAQQTQLVGAHDKLADHFSDPPLEDLRLLNIIAYRADRSVAGQKRRLSQAELRDEIVSAAQKRLALGPSEASKPASLRQDQDENRPAAIYNCRPLQLIQPPVAIWHPVFAKFKRLMAVPTEELKFDNWQLRLAHVFMSDSLELYETAQHRADKLKTFIFGYRSFFFREDIPAGDSSFSAAGAETVTIRLPGGGVGKAFTCFQELNNEIGDGQSDSMAKAECDYMAVCSSKEYLPIRENTCCPAFLLSMAGPNIAVSGAVCADSFICERLTDYIFIGPYSASSTQSRVETAILRVAQLMSVLNKCLDDLRMYYEGLIGRTEGRNAQLKSAAFNPHFTKFSSKDGKLVELEYIERLVSHYSDKALWKAHAKTDTGASSPVVVKFTSKYNPEAHALLADASLAPNLWFCERVSGVGGLYVVIMDFVETRDVANIREHPSVVQSVRRAVNLLHEHKLVYGDLREPNVLVTASGDDMRLVDFDWCGMEGEARYPSTIFLEAEDISWHWGVRRWGLIKKEHDKYMFKVMAGEDL